MTAELARIRSRDNPLFREVLALAGSARERRRAGRSLIEGVHLCAAYLGAHGLPHRTVVTERALAHAEVATLLDRHGVRPTVLAPELFTALSSVEQGIGLAMVVDTPRPAMPAEIGADAVYLDRVQDPGNVGTLLRTAAAAGVRTLLTGPGTAWCWSPKVLRAGMGAHFHLSIHESVTWATVLPRLRVPATGTRSVGAPSLHDTDLRAPRLWVFGGEGDGVSAAVAETLTQWVGIPQSSAVESLNVAAAAAVCLFEQRRQRAAAR